MTRVDALPLTTRIADALEELWTARANREHSPNSDTELMVEQAEARLNQLLERQSSELS